MTQTLNLSLSGGGSGTSEVTVVAPQPPIVEDGEGGYQVVVDGHLLHDSKLDFPRILSPKLDLELNTTGKLTFKMLPVHPEYNWPRKMASTIDVYEEGNAQPLFTGRILNDDIDMDNIKSVECEGALSYSLDTLVRQFTWGDSVDAFLQTLIDNHNSQQPDKNRQFTMGLVTVKDPNDYLTRALEGTTTTYDILKSRLFDSSLGGYMSVRKGTDGKLYLDYTKDSGPLSSQVLRFGENILDITQHIRGEDIKTAIVPYGAQIQDQSGQSKGRVDITSVNGGKDYIIDKQAADLFGVIYTTQIWDDVTLPQNLLQRAWDYLAANRALGVTIELTALDLHLLDSDISRFRLGDYVRVASEPHNLDIEMQITKMSIDMENPANSTITLGFATTTLIDHTVSQIAKQADVVTQRMQNNLDNAVTDVRIEIADLSSVVDQQPDQILMSVSQEYATKSALSETDDQLKVQMQMQADNVTFSFVEAHSLLDWVDAGFQAYIEQQKSYIRMDIDGLTLGEVGNPLQAQLTHDELAFIQNGNKVAYISDHYLYITDAQVLRSFTIGDFAFDPRENGNLSFVWRGDGS